MTGLKELFKKSSKAAAGIMGRTVCRPWGWHREMGALWWKRTYGKGLDRQCRRKVLFWYGNRSHGKRNYYDWRGKIQIWRSNRNTCPNGRFRRRFSRACTCLYFEQYRRSNLYDWRQKNLYMQLRRQLFWTDCFNRTWMEKWRTGTHGLNNKRGGFAFYEYWTTVDMNHPVSVKLNEEQIKELGLVPGKDKEY